ncbi:hypothetical protein HY604_04570 [Candidatus Peregrinibacteria bacterium]|nr:hypothetical protein [Candidatus Peregrinibacteria bacterium]
MSELEILYFSNFEYESSLCETKMLLDVPVPCDARMKNANASRRTYIKKSLRDAALSKTGNRCAYANCNKPYKVLHHIERWAKSRSHFKKSWLSGAETGLNIIPLCKEHHAFMHNGLIDEENFTIRETANLEKEDLQYLEIRKSVMES